MKEPIKKLRIILTVFDILIIFAITGLTFFSIFSYQNIEIQKTEDYLNYFSLTLKIVYYLGIIAIIHMFLSLVYFMYKKIKGENEI